MKDDYREHHILDGHDRANDVKLRLNDAWDRAALTVEEYWQESPGCAEVFLGPSQLEALASAALALRDRIVAMAAVKT